MADTAIWSTLSWPLANVVSARALIYDLVGIVPAFGPCFACSCDQKVRARLLVSSHRYFYKVRTSRRVHTVRKIAISAQPQELRRVPTDIQLYSTVLNQDGA